MGSFRREIDELSRLGLTGAGVAIGHLDSGIDSGHPLFAGTTINFARFGYRLGERQDDTGNDCGGHGTHTAALIVGGAFEDRKVGIAPQAHIYSGAVIEAGNIVARILTGLDWLLETDVGVVNLSLGVFNDTPIFYSLVKKLIDRDVIVVCPAGNRGAGAVAVPGSYPECLTVGACDDEGVSVAFSGSSRDWETLERPKPDVLAPGVNIVSAAANGTLCAKTGTSQASAMTAGLAVLLRQAFSDASAADVVAAIRDSGRGPCAGQSHRSACGMIRPMTAYSLLASRSSRTKSHTLGPVNSALAPTTEPYVGKRLKAWLASGCRSPGFEVILEFRSREARESFVHQAHQDADRTEVTSDLRQLQHGEIVIGRFNPSLIEETIISPGLCKATAADIDRLRYISGPSPTVS